MLSGKKGIPVVHQYLLLNWELPLTLPGVTQPFLWEIHTSIHYTNKNSFILNNLGPFVLESKGAERSAGGHDQRRSACVGRVEQVGGQAGLDDVVDSLEAVREEGDLFRLVPAGLIYFAAIGPEGDNLGLGWE